MKNKLILIVVPQVHNSAQNKKNRLMKLCKNMFCLVLLCGVTGFMNARKYNKQNSDVRSVSQSQGSGAPLLPSSQQPRQSRQLPAPATQAFNWEQYITQVFPAMNQEDKFNLIEKAKRVKAGYPVLPQETNNFLKALLPSQLDWIIAQEEGIKQGIKLKQIERQRRLEQKQIAAKKLRKSSIPKEGLFGSFWVSPLEVTDFKETLNTLINDQGMYPTLRSKIEALESLEEISGLTPKNYSGAVKIATEELIKEFKSKLVKLPHGNTQNENSSQYENIMKTIIELIRDEFSNELTMQEYMTNLTQPNAFIKKYIDTYGILLLRALLSEYLRTQAKIRVAAEMVQFVPATKNKEPRSSGWGWFASE